VDEPLARYYEVRPNGRRQFELFANRVIVNAKSVRGEFVTTIMLADLRPEPNMLRVRPKEFRLGLFMLATSIGLGFAAFLVRGLGLLPDDKAIILMSAPGAALFVSLVIMAATFRKIEFIQFVSKQGKPLLDIAKAGPQREGFRPFVEALIVQIASGTYGLLRGLALSVERSKVGITEPPSGCPIWGLLMEERIPLLGTTITLFSLADGTTSMYLEKGGSVIGGHSHESVRQAAAAFLAAANRLHRSMEPSRTSPLPAKGCVAFYARTDAGLLAAEPEESELLNGRDPFSPLFAAGHVVIAELRKVCQAPKAGSG
jgi:hypothetical protein